MLKRNETAMCATFDYKDGFKIDICLEEDGFWVAWLYHRDYGIKTGMFGQSSAEMGFAEFVELVEANLETEGYIEGYIEDFMMDEPSGMPC